MLLKHEIEIGPDETAPQLAARMAEVGAPLVSNSLHGLARKNSTARSRRTIRSSHARPSAKKRTRPHQLESPRADKFTIAFADSLPGPAHSQISAARYAMSGASQRAPVRTSNRANAAARPAQSFREAGSSFRRLRRKHALRNHRIPATRRPQTHLRRTIPQRRASRVERIILIRSTSINKILTAQLSANSQSATLNSERLTCHFAKD